MGHHLLNTIPEGVKQWKGFVDYYTKNRTTLYNHGSGKERLAIEALLDYVRYESFDATQREKLIKQNLQVWFKTHQDGSEDREQLTSFSRLCVQYLFSDKEVFDSFQKALGGKEKKEEKKQEIKDPEEEKHKKKSDRIDYSDGGYYIGDIQHGVPHGKGKRYWIDGDWYDGDWINGNWDGKGVFYSAQYKRTDAGTYEKGKRYGRGKIVWSDGDRYEGEWNENGKHGQGTSYSSENKRTDTGDYIDGFRNGYGIMKWAVGDRYEGTWKDSHSGLQGEGTYYYANGYSEQGRFINGKWVKSSGYQTFYHKRQEQTGLFHWIRTHKLVTGLLAVILIAAASAAFELFNKKPGRTETPVSVAYYYVDANMLNIRERPDARSVKIGQIKYGDKIPVEIYDMVGTGFAKINHQGIIGYVANKYLRPVDDSGDKVDTESRQTTGSSSSDGVSKAPLLPSKKATIPTETAIVDEQERGESTTVKSSANMATPDTGPVAEDIIERAEQMPVFPGGADALSQFVRQNLRYPVIAAENGVQGSVVLRFVVDKTGYISDITVLNSLDPACDNEAIRTVKSMPRWSPGMKDGQPVNVYYTLPIVFKLTQKMH